MHHNLVQTKQMPTYKKELFDLIHNKECTFYKLFIDGKCLFDEFVEELKKMPMDYKCLPSVYALMERYSPHQPLPPKKFRNIKGIKRKDVYEFKSNKVRIYVILNCPKVYIITGSVKNDQDKTIKRIDKKIKDYQP